VVDQGPDRCFRDPDMERRLLVAVPGGFSDELLAEEVDVD
jgi:hypothetical protein